MNNYENDETLKAFLEVQKPKTRSKYKTDMLLFSNFVKMSPTEIQILREQQEKSDDKKQKFFFETKLKEFHTYLKTEYKGMKGKPVTESSASSMSIGVRGFFKYIRSPLKMQKGDIPQPDEAYGEHFFSLEELQRMYQMGVARQKAILICGTSWAYGAEDFTRLRRDKIEPLIAEVEQGLKRYPVPFSTVRRKTKAEQLSFLTQEIAEALKAYWKTIPKKETVYTEDGDPNIKNGETVVWLFPTEKTNGESYKEKMCEENLNDLLRSLWKKTFPNLEMPNIHWHLLRKFFLSRATELNIGEHFQKRFTGKKIPKDMNTYIRANALATWEKLHEAISLTSWTNHKARELEEIKEELEEHRSVLKVMAKYLAKELTKETYQKIMEQGQKGETMGLLKIDEELQNDMNFLMEFAKKEKKKEGNENEM